MNPNWYIYMCKLSDDRCTIEVKWFTCPRVLGTVESLSSFHAAGRCTQEVQEEGCQYILACEWNRHNRPGQWIWYHCLGLSPDWNYANCELWTLKLVSVPRWCYQWTRMGTSSARSGCVPWECLRSGTSLPVDTVRREHVGSHTSKRLAGCYIIM